MLRVGVKGSESPTTSVIVEEDPTDEGKKIMTVNARLSHGNNIGSWQEDDELIIKNYSGDCIEGSPEGECLKSEFTDTNVLRIVDLTEVGIVPDSKYNGLYLSNVWDCGQYTLNGEGTPGNKYQTDESTSSQDIYDKKYRNGVR